jgi:tripartite-type tricarboxylate transporter receptor subunit TctC
MKLLLIFLIACVTSLSASAFTPERPVSVVIAYGPGSGNEILFRKIDSIITKNKKINFIYDFKPGAYELVGMNHFASAANNGYTLFVPAVGTYYGTPVWFKNQLKQDPAAWELIISLGQTPLALFARSDSTSNTPRDVLDQLKNNSKIDIGVGAAAHVMAYENIISVSKAKNAQRIQYNSPAAVAQAVAAKDIEFGITPLSSAMELAKAGKVKIIGVTGKSNHEYPNLASTFTGLTVVGHVGVVLPPGTPAPVVDYYQKIFTQAVATKEYQDFLASINWYDDLKTPDAYRKFFNNQRQQWIPVAETVNFK